eukprot:COSAG01_NODE_48299_length_382_cov_1.830389_2_plen_29_part_01
MPRLIGSTSALPQDTCLDLGATSWWLTLL